MPTTFQNPPGTRDFYPDDMALRRFIEDAWRRVSHRHGFVEVDGPTFEFLDLYKIKSGDEIVSQLFHFESRGEDKTEFALRPEFTPTLARMVAARANALPRPIKWFSIPRCYRAERPQKGRLREFIQWNVDMLGGDTPEIRRQFDLEVAAVGLDLLREFGITPEDARLHWNDRQLVEELFTLAGLAPAQFAFAFHLLDRVAKLAPPQRAALYAEKNIGEKQRAFFEQLANGKDPLSKDFWSALGDTTDSYARYTEKIAATQREVDRLLALWGLEGFAKYDASIVRGLAYYTGFVYEAFDARGQNRAVAGGGRYDKLIEIFGGPSLPATGFAMSDVMLAVLLEDVGKKPALDTQQAAARPDVFIVNALPQPDEAMRLIGALRASTWDPATKRITQPGLNVATSYKTTKNIGKLMQDAAASGARFALLLAPAEWERGVVKLKNLQTREEREVPKGDAAQAVRSEFRL